MCVVTMAISSYCNTMLHAMHSVMYGLELDEVAIASDELMFLLLVHDAINGDHEGSARI